MSRKKKIPERRRKTSFPSPCSFFPLFAQSERGRGTRRDQASGPRRERGGAREPARTACNIRPLLKADRKQRRGAWRAAAKTERVSGDDFREKEKSPSILRLALPQFCSRCWLREDEKPSASRARVGIRERAVLEFWAAARWMELLFCWALLLQLVPLPPRPLLLLFILSFFLFFPLSLRALPTSLPI